MAVLDKKQNKKRKKKKSYRERFGTRQKFLYAIFGGLFVYLLIHLIYLQTFDQKNQYEAQIDQLVQEKQITAQRGNIYDRNMNVLVQDSSAKSVNVIPYDVRDGEQEELATFLSEQLDVDKQEILDKLNRLEDDIVELDSSVSQDKANTIIDALGDAFTYQSNTLYVTPDEVEDADKAVTLVAATLDLDEDEVREKITAKESSTVKIKGKVDNALAESIQEAQTTYDEDGDIESTNGVELLEDKKRYYANGNFASQLLGFTGDDHTGLMGVEATFDSLLSGTDGIVLYQKDSSGKTIASQTRVIQESEPGEDLVLTLDSNIQIEAEKLLSDAVTQWKAKSGSVIVTNIKTGEILAMATEPDFNLNEPYQIDTDWQSTHAEDLTGLTQSEILEQMWRNQAVSFVYEPGSTFKPITVATALEEGSINPDMTVTCTGSINVNGTTINCTGVHGTQTIAQALENSCNPGLVQIIENLDPTLFYRYVYDFGFGETTGIELTGEEEGIINRIFTDEDEGTYNMVDYSTFSFGQGLATTPIQLICALNALVNNGNYVKPQIQYGVTEDSPRQIVSSETSEELRNDLRQVITGTSSLNTLAEGYSMGGKSGTAEKFKDGSYQTGVYVTSFYCFAPVEDPEYGILVLLDEPSSDAYGGTSAGPVAINLMKKVLSINGGSDAQSQVANTIIVPDLVGLDIDTAKELLESRGIIYQVNYQADGARIVTAQSIASGTAYSQDTSLILEVSTEADSDGVVPDFTGMSVQAVNEKVKKLGLKLKVDGSGFAVSQSIPAGSKTDSGAEITVKFQ